MLQVMISFTELVSHRTKRYFTIFTTNCGFLELEHFTVLGISFFFFLKVPLGLAEGISVEVVRRKLSYTAIIFLKV